MNDTPSIGLTLQGLYKVAVVDDTTGQEVWCQPEWGKNLILNQGMDAIASRTIAECFRYGVAGTGVRFNNIYGGESSGSAINGMFRLLPVGSGIQDLNSTTYGGWVGGVLQAGDTIQFTDASEITIAGVGDISASLSVPLTVPSQSFVIWKTSQTGLQSELKRAGNGITGTNYYAGENNCTSYSSSYHMWHHFRAYDFSVEASLRNYTEVGVAWDTDDSPIKSTFSRILLPAAVTVNPNQRLRLYYNLNVCYSPESASYVLNAPVDGWPTAPATNTNMTQSIQRARWVSFVNPDGTSYTSYAALDPSSTGGECAFFASTISASLVQLGNTVPARSGVAGSYASVTTTTQDLYLIGSYKIIKTATFPRNVMNYTTLRSFGFGVEVAFVDSAYSSTGQAFTMLFEQSQSKFDTQTLTLSYLWSWRRVLTS